MTNDQFLVPNDQFPMTNDQFNNKGAIGLLTTLVLGIILIMLAVTIVLTGISSRTNAFILNQSEKVFISMEGCAEEAFIHVSRDNDYSGGSYEVDGVDCTASISGSDPNRNIIVTGIKDTITRDASLSVQVDPDFAIISWNE